MSTGEPHRSSAARLVQRLLWNWVGRTRQQPVVVLLGPVGAGKSRELQSISEGCGAGVVHARFDFERTEPATTVQTLAWVAEDLSRGWMARPSVGFTRFTLGLIAVETSLDGMSREQAKEKLRASIEDFARSGLLCRSGSRPRILPEGTVQRRRLLARTAGRDNWRLRERHRRHDVTYFP